MTCSRGNRWVLQKEAKNVNVRNNRRVFEPGNGVCEQVSFKVIAGLNIQVPLIQVMTVGDEWGLFYHVGVKIFLLLVVAKFLFGTP